MKQINSKGYAPINTAIFFLGVTQRVGLFALTLFAHTSQKGVQTMATIPNACYG